MRIFKIICLILAINPVYAYGADGRVAKFQILVGPKICKAEFQLRNCVLAAPITPSPSPRFPPYPTSWTPSPPPRPSATPTEVPALTECPSWATPLNVKYPGIDGAYGYKGIEVAQQVLHPWCIDIKEDQTSVKVKILNGNSIGPVCGIYTLGLFAGAFSGAQSISTGPSGPPLELELAAVAGGTKVPKGVYIFQLTADASNCGSEDTFGDELTYYNIYWKAGN